MIFNTWTFALFALITLGFYWCVVPTRWRPAFLVAAGCVFYAYSVPVYLALIVVLGAITFACARGMLSAREHGVRKSLLASGVVLIAGVLVTFKYLGFLAATIDAVARHAVLPVPHLIVPLAISFFTFEFVHVLVDVYFGKISAIRAMDFAVFTMFFPTLVAGPIKRYQTFAPQLEHLGPPGRSDLALNTYRIVMGLAKKFIIADSMNILTQPILTPDAQPYGRLDYVVAMLAYTAKIYFDFTAYSDIAIGVSGLLGIVIPENFARPYWSPNIAVFWRRWHMSLSSWIRDYIFIPLGGSRRPAPIVAFNLLLAMALAGLWHGAAWTFVAWGLWHGIGLAVQRTWSLVVVPRVGFFTRPAAALHAVSVVGTFAFVVAGWVLFAAPSFDAAAKTLTRSVTGTVPQVATPAR